MPIENRLLLPGVQQWNAAATSGVIGSEPTLPDFGVERMPSWSLASPE